MPGPGSYGPGGKWIHDRAHRMLSETKQQYGPEKGKQVAYAIATQMAHKLKKAPKIKGGYGTTTGRKRARSKFNEPPKEYQKKAMMDGFADQMIVLAHTLVQARDQQS